MNKLRKSMPPPARVRATDAKQRFGELIEAAARGPVAIERHGRVIAYLLSRQAYEELAASAVAEAGDAREAKRAQQAHDRQAVRAGRAGTEAMRLIPSALARKAKVRFKPVFFDD